MKNKGLVSIISILLNFGYFLSFGQGTNLVNNPSFEKARGLNSLEKAKVLCATVISDNATYLIWEPSKATNFAFYKVYRQDILTGNYTLVKTISNISLSNFSDDSLNTLANSYCYKVQIVDTLGAAISLDSLQEHCTINAITKGAQGGVQVNWNSYVGARVDSYSIYRIESNTTTQVLVAKVPANVLSIIDTTVYCSLDFSYRIKANKLDGYFISSSSDTSIAKPTIAISVSPSNNLLESTTFNNNIDFTKWETLVGSVKPIYLNTIIPSGL